MCSGRGVMWQRRERERRADEGGLGENEGMERRGGVCLATRQAEWLAGIGTVS